MSRFDQQDADRRIGNLAQTGVVEEVRHGNPPAARVRIGEVLTGWLRMGTPRAGDAAVGWAYSVGEEVLVVASSGDLSQGVIVCALANGDNAAPSSAEEFKAVLPGGVVLRVAGGALHITAPGNVVVTGDVIADGISLKTHTHGAVTPGPADTGGPK